MLPFSCQVPNLPLVPINANQIPPIPQCNCPPELNHILVDLALAICNKTIQYSTKNSVRCFFLNLISRNNWFNQDFAEIFNYCLNHFLFTINNSGTNQNIYQTLDASIEAILTLYSSELVFKFNELQQYISPDQFESSSQNANIFQNMKPQLGNVYNSNNARQINYIQNNNRFDNHMYNGDYSHNNNGFINRQNNYWNNDNRLSSLPFVSNRFKNDDGLRNYDEETQNKNIVKEPYKQYKESFSNNDYRYSNNNNNSFDTDEISIGIEDTVFSVETTSGHDAEVIETVIVEEELLPMKETNDSVDNVATSDKNEVAIEVSNSIIVDLGIDFVIAELRNKAYLSSDDNVLSQYGIESAPIISSLNVKNFINSVIEFNKPISNIGLKDISYKLQNFFSNSKKPEDNDKINLVNQFNNWLTDKINYFINHNLNLNLNIGSFSSDYIDLCDLIKNKTSNKGLLAFNDFSKNIVYMLRSKTLREQTNNQELIKITKGINVEYLPSTYTVMVFKHSREELNLPDNSTLTYINSEEQTKVYLAVKDLFLSQDVDSQFDDGILVEKHIIVTMDNVKYRVNKDYETDQLFVCRIW